MIKTITLLKSTYYFRLFNRANNTVFSVFEPFERRRKESDFFKKIIAIRQNESYKDTVA